MREATRRGFLGRVGATVVMAACCLAGIAASAPAQDAASRQGWTFAVTPYLWVPAIDIETSLPDRPPSEPPEDVRFDTGLTGAAMLTLRARHGAWGGFVDFAYAKAVSESVVAGVLYSGVRLDAEITHATAVGTYRVPMGPNADVDLLAGARLWWVDETLKFAAGVLPAYASSGGETWLDPLLGVDVAYRVGRDWRLTALVTLANIGSGDTLSVETFAGVGYRVNDRFSATAGYRYLREEYADEGFSLDATFSGFMVGAGFHF